MTAIFHDGQFPDMGLISHKSMQILIPTIPVGLFSKTGVKYGVASDMLFVHNSGFYMQKMNEIIPTKHFP